MRYIDEYIGKINYFIFQACEGDIPTMIDPQTGQYLVLAEDNKNWYAVDPQACGLNVPQYSEEQKRIHNWVKAKVVSEAERLMAICIEV